MEKQKREIIVQVLKTLGVSGEVRIIYRSNAAVVYVDGKYFGIYDFKRNTFTD